MAINGINGSYEYLNGNAIPSFNPNQYNNQNELFESSIELFIVSKVAKLDTTCFAFVVC